MKLKWGIGSFKWKKEGRRWGPCRWIMYSVWKEHFCPCAEQLLNLHKKAVAWWHAWQFPQLTVLDSRLRTLFLSLPLSFCLYIYCIYCIYCIPPPTTVLLAVHIDPVRWRCPTNYIGSCYIHQWNIAPLMWEEFEWPTQRSQKEFLSPHDKTPALGSQFKWPLAHHLSPHDTILKSPFMGTAPNWKCILRFSGGAVCRCFHVFSVYRSDLCVSTRMKRPLAEFLCRSFVNVM